MILISSAIHAAFDWALFDVELLGDITSNIIILFPLVLVLCNENGVIPLDFYFLFSLLAITNDSALEYNSFSFLDSASTGLKLLSLLVPDRNDLVILLVGSFLYSSL